MCDVWFLAKYFCGKIRNIFLKEGNAAVYFRNDGLGDFILNLESLSKLVECNKDKKNILICSELCRGLAEFIGIWDEIYTIDKEKYKYSIVYRHKLNRKLKMIRASVLYNMQYTRTFLNELIIVSINAKEKYAFDGENFLTSDMRILSNCQYRMLVTEENNIFELKKGILFVNEIMGTNYKARIFDMKSKLTEKNIEMHEDYFVVFPGGSYGEKLWETRKFKKLIDFIYKRVNIKCYLCGSENEKRLADEIINEKNRLYLQNFIGKTDIVQLIQIINNSKFVIGNDSMGIHLAASLKIPSLVIAGGWHKERFVGYFIDEIDDCSNYPVVVRNEMSCYGCELEGRGILPKKCGIKRGTFSNKKYDCIRNIKVEMVIGALDLIIQNSEKSK